MNTHWSQRSLGECGTEFRLWDERPWVNSAEEGRWKVSTALHSADSSRLTWSQERAGGRGKDRVKSFPLLDLCCLLSLWMSWLGRGVADCVQRLAQPSLLQTSAFRRTVSSCWRRCTSSSMVHGQQGLGTTAHQFRVPQGEAVVKERSPPWKARVLPLARLGKGT